MKSYVLLIFFFCSVTLFAQTKELDSLLEKVNHTTSVQERKILIEKLKQELAKSNKKAKEEANAIIKAKEKIPSKLFKEKP